MHTGGSRAQFVGVDKRNKGLRRKVSVVFNNRFFVFKSGAVDESAGGGGAGEARVWGGGGWGREGEGEQE